MRSFFLIALAFAASPAGAQAVPSPLDRALAEIEAHRVEMRVGCSIPVPALWNAPPWEQRAAAARREAFEDCLEGAMRREQDRLAELQQRVADLHAQAPGADWSAADSALESRWAELDTLAGKLRTRDNWADTAVRVLDTFTGPGAPFGPRPPSWNRCAPYRCDSSSSATGIR
ncbi:MAG TPA: hypothetical protein VF548_15365 [Allosphingosinicella sp.]|jgi:hypothetical protein